MNRLDEQSRTVDSDWVEISSDDNGLTPRIGYIYCNKSYVCVVCKYYISIRRI